MAVGGYNAVMPPARAATLKFTAYFDRDEPDGSPCAACGERCYLWMWRLIMRITDTERRHKTPTVLCESCHLAVMEG